ncbi:putative sugar kinase YdjH [Hartmannibacter diazotrophicus]|uniref:Putative sugar kinase YdjH n=1 Tax=Hartmannibacter diazotrophicus TaxID=1482074 RepID=A0A2C9DBB3_9HYPH|nr:sugar kinase [Hartmannibacter diazotrophicus]SON57460.1 putative sugar kinase YdjH [Hartmannibacter diazotrophicus]
MADTTIGTVVVIGDVMTDIIVRAKGEMVRGSDCRATIRMLPGGSGANQACWLAHAGVPTRFVARVGHEDHARLVTDFAAAGVEAHLGSDADLPSGKLVTLVAADGERSFFTDRGANDALSSADLPEGLLAGAAIVHVSAYALVAPGSRTAVLDFLAKAKAAGIATSIDPSSITFLSEFGVENFLQWTRGMDFCFPNAAEAALLSGSNDPDEQFQRLGPLYKTLVIKRGAQGAEALADGLRYSAPAPVADVIDTTGAGDAFLAAYVAAHLGGHDIATCLVRGTAAGAAITTVLGGRPSALEQA